MLVVLDQERGVGTVPEISYPLAIGRSGANDLAVPHPGPAVTVADPLDAAALADLRGDRRCVRQRCRGHRIGLSRDRHRSDVGHRRRGAFVHHRRGFVRSRSHGRFAGLLGRLLRGRCLLLALAAGGEHERRRGEGGAAQEPGEWGGRGEVRGHSFTHKSKLCPPRSIRERPLGFPCSAFAAGCCGARKAS